MKIKDLIIYGIEKLNKKEDANIIVKLLAMYILNMDKVQLVINENEEVNKDKIKEFYNYIDKIIDGYPIQYIIGKQDFMGYEFLVNENVLIPQPDTEILVEEVIEIIRKKENTEILDICTGSGCIGISIANSINEVKVTLSDISKLALEVAKKNVEKYNLDRKVEIIESNMFENINKKYDVIVSNPPYIEENTINNLDKEVQNEPHLALNGGTDGLDFYKILIDEAEKYLKSDGYLCMEIGYNQKEKILKLIKNKQVYCKKDLAGNDRIIIVKF